MAVKQKNMILKALTNTKDFAFWGLDLRHDYLKELNAKNRQIKITASHQEIVENIINWIADADSDLKIFYKYNWKYENNRTKTTKIYNVPDELKTEIDSIIDNYTDVEYDPYRSGTTKKPVIVYAKNDDDYLDVWFAIKLNKNNNFSINHEDIDENLKQAVEKIVIEKTATESEIYKLTIAYYYSTRIIYSLRIDKSNYRCSLSTDQQKFIDPDADDQPNMPEDRINNFFGTAIEAISKSTPREVCQKIVDCPVINPNSKKRIKTIETDRILLIPIKYEINFTRGDLTEINIDDFINLKLDKLKPTVVKYYNDNATFEGFLKEHQTLDSENNGTVLKVVKNIEGTEVTGQNFLFFAINEQNEINGAKVICDFTKNSLKVSVGKGVTTSENFHKELYQLF